MGKCIINAVETYIPLFPVEATEMSHIENKSCLIL